MDDLLAYVRELKKQQLGISDSKELCTIAGWSPQQILQAITSVYQLPVAPLAPATSTTPVQQTITNPQSAKSGSFSLWIAFEYILLFISLYVMAISLGILLSIFVEYWFPDIALDYAYQQSGYRYESMLSSIRACIAALVVSWPLFSFFFYDIKKKEITQPTVRDLGARKVLIYLTLVVTFVVMTINLIMIVNKLLDGTISSRFAADTVIILSIAGSIFWYYLGQVRQDRSAQLGYQA